MSESARAELQKPAETPPVVVKKYANRRLYNTESSSYITLDNLAEMIRKGRDFVVYDAKSGDDITRGVLAQIIVEEEGKGRAMLPTGFLRHLIGFYGDSMQNLVPRYLEQAMAAFAQQQQQMRSAMQQTMGSFFPFGNVDDMSRQNIAVMERAMSLFAPFYRPLGEEGPPPDAAGLELSVADREIAELRRELENVRRQLADALAAKAAEDHSAAQESRVQGAAGQASAAQEKDDTSARKPALKGAKT
jgi:polyhydroxyalkanoate synthesis repressor PhaR